MLLLLADNLTFSFPSLLWRKELTELIMRRSNPFFKHLILINWSDIYSNTSGSNESLCNVNYIADSHLKFHFPTWLWRTFVILQIFIYCYRFDFTVNAWQLKYKKHCVSWQWSLLMLSGSITDGYFGSGQHHPFFPCNRCKGGNLSKY